jgi:hypothetical protein
MPVSPRHLRAGRAVALATAATVIAGTSHTLAADGPPPVILLLVAAVLATPIALLLIGRRPSMGRTLLTVTAAQTVYHLAFALVGPGGASSTASQGGHLHHVPLTLGEGAVATIPDAPMIGAHAVAAVLTALLLHHGERMLRALGRGLRALVAGPPPLAVTLRASIVRLGIDGAVCTPLAVAASGCSSRGPPARTAVI